MSFGSSLIEAVGNGGLAAVPIAFAAGAVMGLNPCCLAMYPAAAACCASACSTGSGPKPVIKHAGLFVLGNAVAMTILGVLAALVGRTLGGLGEWWGYVIGMIPVIMGAHLLGFVRLPMPSGVGMGERGGLTGAFLGGLLLSLAIGPCGTPAVAAILSYAAVKGAIGFAAVLLFAYGLGNGLPLLVLGTLSGSVVQKLQTTKWSRFVERGAGLAMVLMGYFLLWTA